MSRQWIAVHVWSVLMLYNSNSTKYRYMKLRNFSSLFFGSIFDASFLFKVTCCAFISTPPFLQGISTAMQALY